MAHICGLACSVLVLVYFASFCVGQSSRALLQQSNVQQQLLSKYYSNVELAKHMRDFANNRCKKISRVFTWGKSTQGEDMLALEISEAPGKDEGKPYFRMVGNIHGDEPAGRQLLLLLAEVLCEGYNSKNATLTALVRNMHLVLIPTMNPDGFSRKTRENIRNVDLNRDFPDPWLHKGRNLSVPLGKEQKETLAMMNLTKAFRFVGSLSFHEGALVANYPYDGYADGAPDIRNQKHTSPDDSAFSYLATQYAKLHTTMSQSQEFPGGITNGAQWYPVYGGMQDWSYLVTGCMELTIEVNDDKWPSVPRLGQVWKENLPALLKYPQLVAWGGLYGTVHSLRAAGRLPIRGATVQVIGLTRNVTTSQFGDFYRPLAPGNYTVRVSANKHLPVMMNITVPADGSGLRLSFNLSSTEPTASPGSAEALLTGSQSSKLDIQAGAVTVQQQGIKSSGVGSLVMWIVLPTTVAGVSYLLWRRYSSKTVLYQRTHGASGAA
mmetsp:Transcript_26432/g.57658  ORF Transcript_26432/g.57658 Transcript_26432/m.57658 type:complete len:493 (+) Transcript_26432:213-1691(+)|eukprot:CAMPEP_0202904292 /NCGR_PEP_ID=MMETSP1392-20130828/28677_1 /ASSEMBLY_ACC=CAM_ASM_000868 /TAXON_ID=225041 /ORGANISM="Chlamydomonas chlamydogama, Strain SAG 11-48b" /LENGTH=492 /DNA_ID=CAMNT_0049591849 /DNA_START=142 /DNA_END=1620 /DNA_ORIENTATION=-